jgi:hypothetical protein
LAPKIRISYKELALKMNWAHSNNKKLSEAHERGLLDHVKFQHSIARPVKLKDISKIANYLLKANGNTETVGKNWASNFVTRHNLLEVKRPVSLEQARIDGTTHDKLEEFITTITSQTLEEVLPENRWNMDETGFQQGEGRGGQVVGLRGEPAIQSVTGRSATTTVIETVSATGKSTRALVIFKGKTVQGQWFPKGSRAEDYKDMVFEFSDSGFTNNNIAWKWLTQVFIPDTMPKDKYGNDAPHIRRIVHTTAVHTTCRSLFEGPTLAIC